MDPTPTMIIDTPAAARKGQLVVTLANAAELRAAIDQAERGLLAAQAAMAASPVMTDSERDCPSYNPDGSGEHCYRSGVHDEHRDANGDTWTTAEPVAPAPPATITPAAPSVPVPLDESLLWARDDREPCGWSGPDGYHCLLRPHGPRVMHAAPVGAAGMRRWPALRSVTA